MSDMYSSNDPFGTPEAPTNGNGGFDFDEDVTAAALPPAGEYLIRCVELQKGNSQSGNDQFIWDFVIVASADGSKLGVGKQVRSWTALTDNAKWKVLEHAAALGVTPVEGKLRFNRSQVIGKHALALLEESTYNGRTNMKIKTMKAAPDGVVQGAGRYLAGLGEQPIDFNGSYTDEEDSLK